jgi:GTPase
LLDKEVPHGIAVAVDRMSERTDGSGITDIDATIYCERESHKGIVIGKNGSMLKKVGSYAREDMEQFFGCKIFLRLWVKVKEDWRNRDGLLHSFGFDAKDLES